MSAFLGVLLHAIGGFAAGSFYIPFKMVKKWSWESAWFVLGVAAWLVVPMLAAAVTVPDLWNTIASADSGTLFWTYFFGVLWGIGGLTFGLTMRYLGVSLGMTVALGFTAAFGTLIPPIYYGKFGDLLNTQSGLVTLAGVLLSLVGIAVCGKAGTMKEQELDDEAQKESIAEYDLKKGLIIASVSGILSACFAFALQAGGPIAKAAIELGTKDIFQNNAVLVVILLGGITTNGIWSLLLNFKNKTGSDYTNKNTPLTKNYLWASLGGLTWYLQFFFYGMGVTFLGKKYDFASWSIHMAFIIFFSNLWGMYFKEWKGVSKKTEAVLFLGLAIIVVAIGMIGLAGYFFG
ncbi:MAG TPA: L-rhamnose/proton symporter RhaT [Bacteroidetes bacterium]|nr:L-rhamnose/proton symporter RhaT [Bacteroidota bacterium]